MTKDSGRKNIVNSSVLSNAVAGAIWTIVRTDFKVRYHGTAMGFLWAMLKPLAIAVVLMAVFSFIFSSKPDYAIHLVIGLFIYDFFSEGTKAGMSSLLFKGYLVAKSNFPRWIIVVSSLATACLNILVASSAILVYLAFSGRPASFLSVLLYLLYLVLFLLIMVGFSLASSVLLLRFRDLNQIWDVVAQAGFFVAPVIYPLDVLPEKYHALLYLWPPTAVIQFSREVLLRSTCPSFTGHMLLLGSSLFALLIGMMVYMKMKNRIAEHL